MSARASKKRSETDWDTVDALGDEEIDTSDIAPLPDSFFVRAQLRTGGPTVGVVVHLHPELVSWYRRRGRDWERRMAAVLRAYAETHGAPASTV